MLFHSATVFQERNAHSLLRDFEEEVPGYLNNHKMALALNELELGTGAAAIPDNLRRCYSLLVQREWVGPAELELLDAWLLDLADLR